MKEFLSQIRGAIVATLVLAVVCCGVYPVTVWVIAQVVFHDKANGSLITGPGGSIRGSRLIAQGFSGDKYFQPRPSNAGVGYDGASSGGSNLGPTSQKLADTIRQDVMDYKKQNSLDDKTSVPADAVTRSASGLDPHISVGNAELQAPRVAKARDISVKKIMLLIRSNTTGPDLGFIGMPGVNVLTLNLALDELQ